MCTMIVNNESAEMIDDAGVAFLQDTIPAFT
jgi:hypothetical protein